MTDLNGERAPTTVGEIAGRCQESVYPGVCGNWLPCGDHDEPNDDDEVLH